MNNTQEYQAVVRFFRSLPELRQEAARQEHTYHVLERRLEELSGKEKLSLAESAEMQALPGRIGRVLVRQQRAGELAERREREVSALIEALSTPAFRFILRMRYCEGRRWQAIQDAMPELGLYYSQRQMFRIHARAMDEAGRLYRDRPDRAAASGAAGEGGAVRERL